MRTGSASEAVVESLVAAGVDHAFTVPGESFLGLLDALHREPNIRVITTRHESGAGFMAEAFGKLTHRPAVCMATRTVGGANLAIGIHTARQDSTPLIAVLGQVPAANRHREAFQESELPVVFGPMTKWAVEVSHADRAGELTYRAGRLALDGRPGPVLLAFAENILEEQVPMHPRPKIVVPRPAPSSSEVGYVLEMLAQAQRPVMVFGKGVLESGATSAGVELAERTETPVVTSFRRPDAFPNDHRLYLGQTGLGSPPSVLNRLAAADVVVVVGSRLSQVTTFGYSVPSAGTRWAHIDLEPFGLVGESTAEIAIRSDAAAFLSTAVDACRSSSPAPRLELAEANRADRAAWVAETSPTRGKARPGFADQQRIAHHLRQHLPADAIVVTDAGNFSGWFARYLRWNLAGTFLGPTSGAMGYAVPAAIGAKLASPEHPVVALAGDGGFLMTASELATAAQEGIAFVSVVFDNTQYGTIRMHQEKRFPGRPVGTELSSVDFANLTVAHGGVGFDVADAGDFPDAFHEALGAGVPATIAVSVDPDQISVAQDSD